MGHNLQADGVDQVRLAHARGPIEEEGVEGALPRIACDGQGHGARQFVAIAFDEGAEGVVGNQSRREGRLRLCSTFALLFGQDALALLLEPLHFGNALCVLPYEGGLCVEHLEQCGPHEVAIVLADVVAHEFVGRADGQGMPRQRHKLQWREPGVVLLIRQVLLQIIHAGNPFACRSRFRHGLEQVRGFFMGSSAGNIYLPTDYHGKAYAFCPFRASEWGKSVTNFRFFFETCNTWRGKI